MADYNRDEMRRQELRITSAETKKKPIVKAAHLDIEIDIDDDLFLKVAKAAHERDITINTMINNIIKDKLHDLDYKFEHNPKPQFLAENK
tara:strand:+ start:366 stop:635 length:270 start_codon:yes stop_codon:yes gene_type:complete